MRRPDSAGEAEEADRSASPPDTAIETARRIGGDPSPHATSGTFSPAVIEDIQIKAELARYRIRGFGALRERTWATFDDLTFLPGTLTRIPLEGYREACVSRTVLGSRFAAKPIELEIPLMVTGMSYEGPLAARPRPALARAGAACGHVLHDRRRRNAGRRARRVARADLRGSAQSLWNQYQTPACQADAIELTIGPGAKPGTGGLLLRSKVSDEIAGLRDLPAGVDQRSPCRHPDFLGPDDLIIKIEELREATNHRVPIFVKMGASRVFDDVRLAAKAGADVIVVDGMEGGTGASPELLQEHTGIPTLAAVCEARAALEDVGLYGTVQLVIAGGLRHGSDCAKALALGADACYLGTALLIALNCNKPIYIEDYHKIGAAPYSCHHCHTGRCPVGITTQDPELSARLDIEEGAARVANFFHALTSEIQILARACGKSDVHHLEPEDLRALTMEASLITGLPLAGTNRVFAGGPGWKDA